MKSIRKINSFIKLPEQALVRQSLSGNLLCKLISGESGFFKYPERSNLVFF